MKKINAKIKRMNFWDLQFVKLAVIAFTLFLIVVWSGLHDLVIQAHWGWYLGAMVVLSIEPFVKVWCK